MGRSRSIFQEGTWFIIIKSTLTKKLNINVIDETASFDLFKKFGFVSGRDVNKFEGEEVHRSPNGLVVLENNVNADGSINVPKALQPYMGGKEKILPKNK